MNDKLTDLQQIIAISQAMLEQARTSSWEDVIQLEDMRGKLIAAFFSSPVEAELTKTVTDGIKLILAIDQETMALAQIEKQDVEQILLQIGQGKKAVKAYSY